MKFAAIAIGALGYVSARDVVAETWERASSTLADAEETLSEVRKHAAEAAVHESEEVAAAKRSMHDSEKELEKSAEAFREAEEKLMASKDTPADKATIEASFMELPDSFSQFPGVKEDMAAVKSAEKTFKAKMEQLRNQDNDLMKMARQNFAEAGQVAGKIGHLRSSPISFIEQGSMPESFKKVLEAEDNLKKINDELAKEFHLA
jgi:uncharacterized phage infection (PIP) family protein YhgE